MPLPRSERDPDRPDASGPFPFEKLAVGKGGCSSPSASKSFVQATAGVGVAL